MLYSSLSVNTLSTLNKLRGPAQYEDSEPTVERPHHGGCRTPIRKWAPRLSARFWYTTHIVSLLACTAFVVSFIKHPTRWWPSRVDTGPGLLPDILQCLGLSFRMGCFPGILHFGSSL